MRALGLAFALAFASTAAAATSVTDPDYPRSLDATGPVTVTWEDPSGFSEIRQSQNRFEARRGDWVRGLARHVASEAAEVLGPGERLEVHILDIKRAGDYEPGGHVDHVRVVRDIYPPRIDLRYARHDASGRLVDSGERRLGDVGFLNRPLHGRASDALRYEKRLIDDWVRRDLAGGAASGGGQ